MDDSLSTSPTLLSYLANPANEDAWRLFVARYEGFIKQRCREAGLRAEDADEVYARVLARLATACREFRYDPARRFRGWLATVVRHVIVDYWEENRRHGAARLPKDLPEHLPLELEERMTQRLLLLDRALALVRERVEPQTWQAFWLTAMEGASGQEAAERLGLPVANIYVYKSRVTKLLRQTAEQLDAGTDGRAEVSP